MKVELDELCVYTVSHDNRGQAENYVLLVNLQRQSLSLNLPPAPEAEDEDSVRYCLQRHLVLRAPQTGQSSPRYE